MANLSWPSKDPDEVLDYQLDWGDRLDGDTIVSSDWTITGTGLTVMLESIAATRTTIWLSGGVLTTEYSLLNRITTTAGRTMDQTVRLKIKSK